MSLRAEVTQATATVTAILAVVLAFLTMLHSAGLAQLTDRSSQLSRMNGFAAPLSGRR